MDERWGLGEKFASNWVSLECWSDVCMDTFGSPDLEARELDLRSMPWQHLVQLHPPFFRYGEELLKLERVTLDSIRSVLKTLEKTEGAPFNPRDCIQELVLQILAVLVSASLICWSTDRGTHPSETAWLHNGQGAIQKSFRALSQASVFEVLLNILVVSGGNSHSQILAYDTQERDRFTTGKMYPIAKYEILNVLLMVSKFNVDVEPQSRPHLHQMLDTHLVTSDKNLSTLHL